MKLAGCECSQCGRELELARCKTLVVLATEGQAWVECAACGGLVFVPLDEWQRAQAKRRGEA